VPDRTSAAGARTVAEHAAMSLAQHAAPSGRMPRQAPRPSSTASGNATACRDGSTTYSAAVPFGRPQGRVPYPHALVQARSMHTVADAVDHASSVTVRNVRGTAAGRHEVRPST
jgi:hypothetical protein